jgi:hypothetical protein
MRIAFLLFLSMPVFAAETHVVRPAESDPRIDGNAAAHIALVDRTARSNGLLLVHLPGTGDSPDGSQSFVREAARDGYHAIALSYENATAVGVLCKDELSCFERVRMEILDGEDRTPLVSVRRANSIEHRLLSLLAFLAKKFPDEKWDAFVDKGMIKWSAVAFSGHSQGGGEAAVIAMVHSVTRVLMFGAPVDSGSIGPTSADWLRKPHATPIDRYFSFNHVRDPYFVRISTNLKTLAVPGPPIYATDPAYGATHQLVTEVQTDGPHGSVVRDGITPVDKNGEPIFTRVWNYMLTAK